MKHTAHGYWLEEVGEVELAGTLAGERERRRGCGRRWLHGDVGGLAHPSELEPEARVVLLEAGSCGEGPSGRNGGFANTMWFSLANMRKRWGDEPALAVARAAEDAVAGIGAFCERRGG